MSKTKHQIVEIVEGVKVEKQYIRLPKLGQHCPITGLGRNAMDYLVRPCKANHFKAAVKSISVRRPGWKRATRLVSYPSLMEYLSQF